METSKQKEFLNLVHQHQKILHKICFIYGGNQTDKEDLYQEIVLQLWKSYPSFKGSAAFSTWMYRVALNTAISFNKKMNALKTKSIADMDIGIEWQSDQPEEIKRLYIAIAALNKIDKGVILLWLDNKSYQEIAEMMGMTVKNVSVRIVRIKDKLAQRLSEKDMNHE